MGYEQVGGVSLTKKTHIGKYHAPPKIQFQLLGLKQRYKTKSPVHRASLCPIDASPNISASQVSNGPKGGSNFKITSVLPRKRRDHNQRASMGRL